MGDIDVKVGIQVAGDASGAQQVDGAIKQVGETAKQVAQETSAAAQQSAEAAAQAAQKAAEAAGQAAEKVGDVADELGDAGKAAGGLGDLNGAVDGLKDALGGLSPEKSKNLINGLTQALLGLGSGDISTGLAGVGKTLFNFAGMIPLPGAAVALGIGVTAISALYKLIGDSTDEPARKLNEFGETVDQEMERLESWAQSQFEWEGIKNANAAVRADFDLLKSSADAALAAVQGVFNAQSNARVSALQREAASAEAAGDHGRAAQIKQQVEDEKSKAELVGLRLEMIAAKAEAAEQKALLQAQSQNNSMIADAAAAAAEKLASVEQQMRDRTGSIDASVDSKSREKLVDSLEDEIRIREKYVKVLAARENGATDPRNLAWGDTASLSGKASELPNLKQLVEDLKNFENIAAAAKETEEKATEAKKKANEEAVKAVTALTELGLKIETLETQIKAVESAVTPEVSEAARQQAGLMAGAVGDFLESTLTTVATDVQGVIDTAAAGVKSMTASAGDLEKAKAAYAESVSLKEIPPVMEDATKQVGEGAAALSGAIEETGAAGGEIKAGAEQFRQQIGGVRTTWQPTIAGLVDSSRQAFSLVSDLAAAQAQLAEQVAAAARAVSAAQADASLALSQIRNR